MGKLPVIHCQTGVLQIHAKIRRSKSSYLFQPHFEELSTLRPLSVPSFPIHSQCLMKKIRYDSPASIFDRCCRKLNWWFLNSQSTASCVHTHRTSHFSLTPCFFRWFFWERSGSFHFKQLLHKAQSVVKRVVFYFLKTWHFREEFGLNVDSAVEVGNVRISAQWMTKARFKAFGGLIW